MSVSDLTGTTWLINSSPIPPQNQIWESINFTSNGSSYTAITLYDEMDMGSIVYRGAGEHPYVAYSGMGWEDDGDRTIAISGGTSATNANLIAWLESNATQVTMDITITYNSSEVTTMGDSGTIVLDTAGTFMTDDITIEYNRPSTPPPNLQAKTNISPTTSSQTITADNGYDGLSSVQINAMPSGTAGTPVATKGTVSNNSISVTPSVTNVAGYITGGTKSGTAVTVSASELVSGTKSITSSGTIDVTNYANVSVTAGSATTPATTVTANPSISVSNSGLITATASATQSVTPTVSAGYVDSGTAGTITVSGSNTSQLTTQAATTYTPTTTDQTIASGKYLTGAQTILGDQNLTAGNIKKDVSIFGVTGTYEGSGGGSKLYIFTQATYGTADATIGGSYLPSRWAFTDNSIVSGATVTFYTYGGYILDSITGEDSGTTYQFTTVSSGTYTFTMPNESIYCALYYDD